MMMNGNHSKYTLVYYCSGHGYGHATRVSAFACHLLSVNPRPTIHIVSSAPKHVFADSIAFGALYRYADIDPVIVQPLAYRVDRQKSMEVLRSFLQKKDRKVSDEVQWLKAIGADCVLSDAAFLGCLAAHHAEIPSVLITNFSFDSVYSYLSVRIVDSPTSPGSLQNSLNAHVPFSEPPRDIPIPITELCPLVDQIVDGFRCADLLLRLPGAIPMPSFSSEPSLPSPQWVDLDTLRFTQEVIEHLIEDPSGYALHPSIPFRNCSRKKPLQRKALGAPLIVRSPNPSVYTPTGREHLLTTIGVPAHLQEAGSTKILIVSFGGQVFHRPQSRVHSRTPSGSGTPAGYISHARKRSLGDIIEPRPLTALTETPKGYFPDPEVLSVALRNMAIADRGFPYSQNQPLASPGLVPPSVITRAGRLHIPGAPPLALSSPPSSSKSPPLDSDVAPVFQTITIPPTPDPTGTEAGFESDSGSGSTASSSSPDSELGPRVDDAYEEEEEDIPQLLPDETWIAIVCGVSKEWGRENGEELPENFFVAPRDVYMPDLTAVADVLLGKLGYGTVSECVDACTPFVYVPRPLFIEEHGLRLLLDRDGVGVELSRSAYEQGEWANAVQEAWEKGKDAKARKRIEGETGKRKAEGVEMAHTVIHWLTEWKKGYEEL